MVADSTLHGVSGISRSSRTSAFATAFAIAGATTMLAQATQSYDELADLRGYVETFERNGVTYYRARFAGFADRTQARTACDTLSSASINCLAVQG